MDYHEGAENYLKAKLGLVERVLDGKGIAVLNADSDVFDDFNAAATARNIKVISYGYAGKDIRLKSAKSHPQGQMLSLEVAGQAAEIDLPLAGEFQALNILCALGVVLAGGTPATDILSVLPKLENVPGRMELVGRAQKGAGVYVDYAHTPDALETVLKSIRPHVENRLIVVFGCGGDRDKGKRPQMGAIAAANSDIAIITDDNPRSEDPTIIRAEIKAACPEGLMVGDRRAAIAKALELAGGGDVVVVAGKGHESGQILADRTIPFDDRVVVRELIASGGVVDG
jgi:UDP-N-acetylmuramoyl-L-alanyl-D-glutamate--2,6-diaminopimelate ligase